MLENCYYTKIDPDNIKMVAKFIELLSYLEVPKTGFLLNIRVPEWCFTETLAVGKYLILHKSTKSWQFDMCGDNPSESMSPSKELDFCDLILKIIRAARCNYDKLSKPQKKLFSKFEWCAVFLMAMPTFNNHNTEESQNTNTRDNENQLQGKETPECLESKRVGTPVRYSGNKLTVAVGHLSNKARTS